MPLLKEKNTPVPTNLAADSELEQETARLETETETLGSDVQSAEAKAQAEKEQAEGLTRKNAELEGQLAALSDERRRREEELLQSTL